MAVKNVQWYEATPICNADDPLKREVFANDLTDIQIHQAVMENILQSNTSWNDKIGLLMATVPQKRLIARQLVYWHLSKQITTVEFNMIAIILKFSQRDLMKYTF
ncbi:MAG: hypothetical protein KAR35_09255 [Candidatus Heimdallarchaeota archaeon]|nr:hypothetical protein [Candidatus Heimdallarchaeota archaeon]MCK5049542.1 hypothetical protein [Candidatus Heimdallarchaeota archaeon]